MSRTRVLDLAKELGIETKVAIIKLQELGIQVKNHFNAVSDLEAAKLRALHRSGKTTEKEAPPKAINKLIIRRKVESVPDSALQEHRDDESVHASKDNVYSTSQDQSTNSSNSVNNMHDIKTEEKTVLDASITHSKNKTSSEHIETKKLGHNATEDLKLDKNLQSGINLEHINISPKNSTETSKTVSLNQGAPIQNQTIQQKNDQVVKSSQAINAANAPSSSAPKAPQFSGGAVIVRRAEPPSAAPQNAPMPPKKPAFSSTQQPGQTSFQKGSPNFSKDNQGNQRPTIPGQTPQGGYKYNPEGGYRPSAAPEGGYRQNSEGGYRKTEGGAPGQGNSFSPRSQGAGYAGGAGGGAPQRGVSYPQTSPRPSFPGSKPFVMADTAPVAAVSKDVPSRIKYPDKDREKRRSVDENDYKSQKNALRLKSNRFEEELAPGAVEIEMVNGEPEERVVRTMIPNRKKTSSFKRKEHKKAEPANPTKASKKVIRIDEFITVNDLASELSQKSTAIIKTLMKLGMMASINQQLDMDTASFVAQEFGFETQNASVSIGDILTRKADKNDEASAESRPPIITIMGHVDHGKTSLLDAIRSAKVADKEAGGITQHIGAYQIDYKGRKLTFLDTPGHEAFTAMRGRGAKVTDIVILVVAADDGVMPQTIEAIAHAKAAQVPIIVAINKIDKPGVNIERITRELADQGVLPEEWGGEAIFVQVSAKTHAGLTDLIEAILLQSDVLDLKASKEGLAEGVVIEAKLDKARGPVATVIVTKGTLKQQDFIVVGKCLGRVRAMYDDHGQKLSIAGPATPVEIIGLDGVPESGDHFNCVASDAIAKEAVAFRIEKQRQKDLIGQRGSTMEEIMAMMVSSTEEKPKELSIIIKADTHGSAEAIKSSVQKLDTAKVKTRIILSAVGGITETDTILAQASNAIIVGFNVRPDKMAIQFAERAGVQIQCFAIIYKLTEAIQAAMLGTLSPVKQDKVLGHAEVRSTFSVPKVGVVAGTMILDGKVTRNSHMRVVRDSIVIYTGRVGSLKRFKDDAKEVAQGFECGISVENYNDLKIGDVLEAFVIEEIAATL